MSYLPSTPEQRREMLAAIGLSSMEELHAGAPEHLLLKNGLNLPEGKPELAAWREMSGLAEKKPRIPHDFPGRGGLPPLYPLHCEQTSPRRRPSSRRTPLSGGDVAGDFAVHL
jgi:glycine dehydrogenase subunit 1